MNAFISHSALSWIIDSSASDHMTGQSIFFSFYTPYMGPDKVKIANGTFFSSVFGKCLVHTTPSLSLSSILYVSNFVANLYLLVVSLVFELQCNIFFFFLCVSGFSNEDDDW